MTGRRLEMVSTVGAIAARRVGIVAFCAALGLAVLGCSTAPTALNSEKAPAAAVAQLNQPTVISEMAISAQTGALRLSFTSDGALVHELEASATRATLTLRNAKFDGLSSTVEVGDGTLDTVEFTRAATGDAQIKVYLATASKVSVEERSGGFDLVIVPGSVGETASAGKAVAPAKGQEVDVRLLAGRIEIDLGGSPAEVGGFLLSDGLRLVVDASGSHIQPIQLIREYETGPIAKIAIRGTGENARAVIEARSRTALEGFRVEKTASGIAVVTSGVELAAIDAVKPTILVATKSDAVMGGGEIVELGFSQDDTKSYIDIDLSKPAAYEVTEAAGTRVVLEIRNTKLPKKFYRALDTSAFAGAVKLIAAYGRGPDVRVIVDLKDAAPFTVESRKDGLAIAFEGGADAVADEKPLTIQEKVVLVPAAGAAAPVVAPGQADSSVALEIEQGEVLAMSGTKGNYTGEKISMDFVNADIQNVLRIIGEVAGFNLVTGSEVTGKLTIRLVDVPWDQALDVILKSKGLGKELEGNIMRIVSAERIAAERQKIVDEEQAKIKAKEELTPLANDIIPVNYAKAEEIVKQVNTVLSPRGSTEIDVRTNTVLIRDLPENIEMAKTLVSRLDTATPQVLIEARIVEVSTTYAKDLGIQWGGAYTMDAAHGNATPFAFPNSIGIQGGTGTGNYAVNLPVAGASSSALALSFGHINDILSLDMRLSALETSGRGRVVSSPRVTTLDNRTAKISQGISIPFTTATDNLIETSSIDYNLELEVTPHVTADNSVMLKISLKKNAPSTTFVAVDSFTPAVETRQADTEVLVRDGETTVIGGIITDTTSNTGSGVPWFQHIPFIGWMFKTTQNRTDKTELIIFITPKIVRLGNVADNK